MSEFVSTPISRFTSTAVASNNKESTPKQFTNPFESYLLERLNTHTYSPSTFAKVISPSEESSERGDFRWSIDHIALLNPAEIEVKHYHQVAPTKSDNETESRYQEMVDKYFAESMVAPSPWSAEKPNKSKFILQASVSSDSSSFEMQNNLSRDACCQTMLTFPPDFDLMQFFGGCHLYKEEKEEMNMEDMNVSVEMSTSGSTLRRRLFAVKGGLEKQEEKDKFVIELFCGRNFMAAFTALLTMTNMNFEFVPQSILKLVAQPYVQGKKPGEHRELFGKWVHKMQATEPGYANTEFAQIQRTLQDQGNTYEVWRHHPDYNRYNDMICFDQTRVVLNDGLDSDYIHANYVDGYQRKHAYILTQGPLENTVCDLWRMVWQEKVATIVMVTRLMEHNKPKSARYFPLSNDVDFQSGVFKISLIKKEERIKCTASFLKVLNLITNEQRYVVHVWYTLWPDQGIPQDVTVLRQCLNYIKLININMSHLFYSTPHQHPRGPPIIYHCSAGIGRSAVMVILDIFSEALLHNEFIDPLEIVLKVRKERYHAVQTKIQLLFIYEYVLSLAAVPRMNLVQQ